MKRLLRPLSLQSRILIIAAMLLTITGGITLAFRLSGAKSQLGTVDALPLHFVVPLGSEHPHHRVRLINLGTGTIKITRVHSTCTCAAATPDRQELQKGQMIDLTLTMRSTVVGTRTTILAVEYLAREKRILEIPIMLTVSEPPAPWIVESPSEIVIACQDNTPFCGTTFEIRAKEESEQPPFLRDIHSGDERLKARLAEIPREETILDDGLVLRTYQVNLTVETDSNAVQPFATTLIPVFHQRPSVAVREIPAIVQLQPRVRVIPAAVDFSISTSQSCETEKCAVIVFPMESAPCEIAPNNALPDWVQVRVEHPVANMTKLFVRVSADNRRLPQCGRKNCTVVVTLTGANRVIELPLRFKFAE